MQFGIEYYYCLGISLLFILLFSLGLYWTNRQNKALQFLTLIIVPLLIYAFFTFTHLGLTNGQSVLGTLVLFIVLVYLGEFMDQDMFSWIPYRGKKGWWWRVPDYILGLASLPGVALFSFVILYLLTTWVVTLIVFGILLLIFLIILFSTYEDFSNWATPLLAKFDLLAVIILLGYLGWSRFPGFINVAVCTVFVLILIHYIVDARKARGLVWRECPSHRYYSGYQDTYPGASAVPLVFALSAAVGFTSWLLSNSAILSLFWIGFGVLNFVLLRKAQYDYDRNYENIWKKRSEMEVLFTHSGERLSKYQTFLYYTRDSRRYLFLLLLTVLITMLLPLVYNLF